MTLTHEFHSTAHANLCSENQLERPFAFLSILTDNNSGAHNAGVRRGAETVHLLKSPGCIFTPLHGNNAQVWELNSFGWGIELCTALTWSVLMCFSSASPLNLQAFLWDLTLWGMRWKESGSGTSSLLQISQNVSLHYSELLIREKPTTSWRHILLVVVNRLVVIWLRVRFEKGDAQLLFSWGELWQTSFVLFWNQEMKSNKM